ncbi:MAG: radical SAM protein [Alphaproteobacteria bacterium]
MTKPTHCIFVHAPDPVYAKTQTYGATFGPLWAYTLASYIPKNGEYTLKLYDNRFDSKEGIKSADVFLYSGINQDCGILNELCEYYRKKFPDAQHIIGGPICMSFDLAGKLDQLAAFDTICIGDGEELITEIVRAVRERRDIPPILRAMHRFPVMKARMIDEAFVQPTLSRYYGGVVEISRGCPFLCEFCDIRTLPDNNRTHIKSTELIIAEMDFLCRNGVRNFLMACDNFIGDIRAAEHLLDEIIKWQDRTGFRPGLYTWLTINVYKMPNILKKMRRCGFDLLFIGIESFDTNSLLETAKVQNIAAGLAEAVCQIQSYGFIVVAGLIQGFDSDSPQSFEATLKGLDDSRLLSGDPSLLVALPGTPLYRRMKLSGRLRDIHFGLGGYKYQSNIKYLMPKEHLVNGFKTFVTEFTKGDYQYRRLKNYFELLESGNFIPLEGNAGFGNIKDYLRALAKDPTASLQMLARLLKLLQRPNCFYYACKGFSLILRRPHIKGRLNYFQFWLFAWTNAIIKYSDLKDEDFDIESVEEGFDVRNILPENYGSTANEPIPQNKIDAQLRATSGQLQSVINKYQEQLSSE